MSRASLLLLGGLAVVLAVAVGAWLRRAAPRTSTGGDESRRILASVVALLSAPRPLDVATVREAAVRAFGWAPDVREVPIDGPVQSFAVVTGGRALAVFSVRGPYTEDVSPSASPDVARALRGHRAWLSVDDEGTLEGPTVGPADAVYPLLGRLLAELAPDDTLALYSPVSDVLLPLPDGGVAAFLRSPELVGALCVGDGSADSVVDAPVGDPELAAAEAEARRRWPEFVAQFVARRPGQSFAVKAPFEPGGGGREFLWVEVHELGATSVRGTVASDPVHVSDLRAHDRVTVPVAEIDDWLWTDGEETHGGFTSHVLAGRRR